MAIDDDTLDALGETFNLALGEASAEFADRVGEELLLSVPRIQLLPADRLAAAIDVAAAPRGARALCRIDQRYRSRQGDFQAQALMVFAHADAREMVRRLMDVPPDEIDDGLDAIELDGLGEVGNVLLNGCMNSLAQVLDRPLQGSLPEVRSGEAERLFDDLIAGGGLRMLASTGMTLASRQVNGHLHFVLDADALAVCVRQVRHFFGLDCGLEVARL